MHFNDFSLYNYKEFVLCWDKYIIIFLGNTRSECWGTSQLWRRLESAIFRRSFICWKEITKGNSIWNWKHRLIAFYFLEEKESYCRNSRMNRATNLVFSSVDNWKCWKFYPMSYCKMLSNLLALLFNYWKNHFCLLQKYQLFLY